MIGGSQRQWPSAGKNEAMDKNDCHTHSETFERLDELEQAGKCFLSLSACPNTELSELEVERRITCWSLTMKLFFSPKAHQITTSKRIPINTHHSYVIRDESNLIRQWLVKVVYKWLHFFDLGHKQFKDFFLFMNFVF